MFFSRLLKKALKEYLSKKVLDFTDNVIIFICELIKKAEKAYGAKKGESKFNLVYSCLLRETHEEINQYKDDVKILINDIVNNFNENKKW